MARVIFPAGNVGEAKAYIKALTGVPDIVIPPPPPSSEIGQVLRSTSLFVSVSASASIGFTFADVGGSVDRQVLLQDYWYDKEVMGTIPEVNSWTFAAGFRVGALITGFKSDLNISLGALAAKASTQGLNIQMQVLRVGMSKGPSIPPNVAFPVALNVDNYGDLRTWQGSVIKYVEDHHSELEPVLVSASVNINGERLLNDVPGVRYSLWRIAGNMTLKQAISLLGAGKAPGVSEGEVRAVYSAIFHDPKMVIPGDPAEIRAVGPGEKKAATDWLNAYKNI